MDKPTEGKGIKDKSKITKMTVEVQTYYTKENGRVYFYQKIGNQEWSKTQTYYNEIPVNQ